MKKRFKVSFLYIKLYILLYGLTEGGSNRYYISHRVNIIMVLKSEVVTVIALEF